MAKLYSVFVVYKLFGEELSIGYKIYSAVGGKVFVKIEILVLVKHVLTKNLKNINLYEGVDIFCITFRLIITEANTRSTIFIEF